MGLAMTRHVDIPMGRGSFSLGGSSPLLGGYFAFYVSQAHMGSITYIEKTIETALSHNQIGTEPRSLSYCNKLFPITLFRSLLPSARTGSALHI